MVSDVYKGGHMGIYRSLPDHHQLQLVLAGEVPWKVPFTPQVAHVKTSKCVSVLLWIMSFVTMCPLTEDAGESTQLIHLNPLYRGGLSDDVVSSSSFPS